MKSEDQVCSQSWNRRTEVQLSPKFGSIIAPECNYEQVIGNIARIFINYDYGNN